MTTARDIRKIALIVTVGLCDALEAGTISIDEAEHYLFSPHTMKIFAGTDQGIVDIVHKATEFENFRSLLPERLGVKVAAVRELALDALRNLPTCDFQQEQWLDKLLPIVDD